MFSIDQSTTFRWEVKFQNLQESGAVKEEKFTAIFKRKTRAELLKLKEEAAKVDIEQEVSSVLTGWDGIQDANGSPVAYSAENKGRLLNILGMVETLFMAFEEAISSGLKIKN